MEQVDKKKIIKIFLASFIALVLAYSFDQYYIYRKELFFLSKPVQVINQILGGK